MIQPSAYRGLMFKSGYFMNNSENIAEYGYLSTVTALRICDALSNFRAINSLDVCRRMLNNPLMFTIGDLTSPLGSAGADIPSFQKIVEAIFETRYGEDSKEVVSYMDFPANVEGDVCSLASVVTMLFFAMRCDEASEFESDIVVSTLLNSAVEVFSRFDFAEINWLTTVEEVADIYKLVAADSKENKTIN